MTESELIPITMLMSRAEWKALAEIILSARIFNDEEARAVGDLVSYIDNEREVWE